MEETKRRVKKAALIIGGTIIIFVVITAWISGITSHFDESNTYVYEGALSYVDRYNTRELRWGGSIYYKLYFTDGQKFAINPNDAADLLDAAARSELRSLPEGKKITVIVSQRYGGICAFWTDERVFISLDDYNARAEKNKLYLFILDACLALIFVPMAVFYDFDAFRQLRISLGKQRRKAKRKQLRSELKDAKKDKRQQ